MSKKPKPATDHTVEIVSSAAYETNLPQPPDEATHTPDAPAFAPARHPRDVGSLGPYRVVKEIGRGGMGAVYLGFDERLKRKVAIKVMLPKYAAAPAARTRFVREARAAAQLSHDHVVAIYDADQSNGVPYMVLQYLQGYPLDRYLKEKPAPTVGDILRIGRETALGLAAAHDLGLVHRDIKLANIWLEAPTGRVKILDFGLARPTQGEYQQIELTRSGAVLGTPAYMAPEQALGMPTDFRADLFSLGVVLYRLCTGRLPFEGKTTNELLVSLAEADAVPVRDVNPAVPEPFARLIHQMLQKRPADRPASAAAVADAIRQIELTSNAAVPVMAIPLDSLPTATHVPAGADPFDGLDATGEQIVRPPTASGNRSRPWWPLAAVAALLLALAVVIPQVIKVTAGKGILVIETADDSIEVTVKQGTATLFDKTKQREIELKVGDDYQIDLSEPKDGLKLSTNKFEITRGGKTVVKVRVEKPAVAAAKPAAKEVKEPKEAAKDADRKAAEYVLWVGGTVKVNGEATGITVAADLPKEPFRLTEAYFYGKKAVTDAGLAAFAGTRNLLALIGAETAITDAGLANFKENAGLRMLDLTRTAITDAGLANFKGVTGLTHVNLWDLPGVTDAGLAHLTFDKGLTTFNVPNTGITDATLARLKGFTDIVVLTLSGTKVTDRGLENFSSYKSIVSLGVGRTAITDAGLAHVKNNTGLREIDLNRTAITDAGLAHLKGVTGLTQLHFGGVSGVTDAGLAHLKFDRRMTVFAVASTGVSDNALAPLKGFTDIVILDLGGTKVTDRGLENLKGCKGIVNLYVFGTAITDAGLAHFDDSTALRFVNLLKSNVTAAKVAAWAKKFPKCRIDHDGGTIEPTEK